MQYKAIIDQDRCVFKSQKELNIPDGEPHYTVRELCEMAGIPYRVSGGIQVLVYQDPASTDNLATINSSGQRIYVVGVKDLKVSSDIEMAARILERLAYAYFDYGARESVASAKMFTA